MGKGNITKGEREYMFEYGEIQTNIWYKISPTIVINHFSLPNRL